VDVRFVSATNRDLQSLCESGAFRADLYFRLSGVVVTIPSLRERPRDVVALAEHFAIEAARRLGRAPVRIDASALDRIRAHSWPGNIRELRNAIERAVLLCRGDVLEAAQLDVMAAAAGARPEARAAETRAAEPPPPREPRPLGEGTFRDQVKSLERERILEALEKSAGNQSRAAKLLGMPRRTFVKRLDEYGIARPRKGGEDES